jgi:hypothetical protein
MNEQEFQDKLADYLAGELTAAQAEAFRAALATDEPRRRLVDELQAAAAALECRDVAAPAAREATAELRYADIAARAGAGRTLSLRPRARWFRFANAAVRYAAAIALAFVAGYYARGGSETAQTHPQPGVPGVSSPAVAVAETGVNDRYVAKYAKAARAFPNASSFSRSLMVVANSSK